MLISRSGATAADIFSGFKAIFNKAFSGAKSTRDIIAMEVKSESKDETYTWLGRFPTFREWAGSRVIQNLESHAYTIRNKSFESTVGVSRDDIEDDNIGIFAPLFSQMGREASIHPDRLAYDLLKRGFTEKCYDGQYFFDTDHPVEVKDGQTVSVSNMQAGDGPAWFLVDANNELRPIIIQIRRPYEFVAMDKPTDDTVFDNKTIRYGVDSRINVGFGLWQLAFGSKAPLTHENFEAAKAAMATIPRDGGDKLGIAPTHLVVPPELEGAARRVLKSDTRIIVMGEAPNEQYVPQNNEWKDAAELVVTPFL